MVDTIGDRMSRVECLARGFANFEALYDTDRPRYERLYHSGAGNAVWEQLQAAVGGDYRRASELVVQARNLRTVRIDYACGHARVKVAPVSAIEGCPGFYRAGESARCEVCARVPEADRDAYWQVITRVTLDGHELAWDLRRYECGHTRLHERRADRPMLDWLPRECEACGGEWRELVGITTVAGHSVA